MGEGFLQVLGVLGELLDAVRNAGTAVFVQLDDGCHFSLQLKHVLSFQYSLYQKLWHFSLCHLCHLYHPFEQMTILQMELSWAQ
jgi:hypothetical protein